MQFLQDLHEARMTRDKSNMKVLTYTDCCERMYLTLLVLECMKNFPQSTAWLRDYCRKSERSRYDRFMMSGTDLYNFVYFITGDENAIGKLKDPGAAMRVRKNTNLPVANLRRYLTQLGSGQTSSGTQQFFISMEQVLGISNTDYKTIRRALTDFKRLSTNDKKALVTRLLYAVRAKLRSSDVIDDFEKVVSMRDLESNWINDPEPTISKPDLSSDTTDYVYYRYLTGTKNLMLVKSFLDLAKEGKPIPGNMVKAYLPAIEALDDIVKGGPSYINMFRSIQNRAKKSLK